MFLSRKLRSLCLLSTVSLLTIPEVHAAPVLSSEDEEAVPVLVSRAKRIDESEGLVTATTYGDLGIKYVDNIYRSPSNEKGDAIGVLRPGVLLRSRDDGYALKARGEVERGQYFSETKNNYTDADLRADATVDVTPITTLYGRARYRFDHVGIGAFIDDPSRAAIEPTLYRYGEVGAGMTNHIGAKGRFDLDAQYDFYNFQNTDAAGGLTIINNDRDRDEYQLTARPGYYIQPDALLYLKAIANWRKYDDQVDATALHSLDSKGYQGAVGIEKGDKKGAYYVDANVGWLDQNYDDSYRGDIDGLAANAELQWVVTPTVTLTGDLSRSVEESTLTDSSGYMRTRVGVGAEYAFMPQWSLGTYLRFTNYDFEINGINGRPDREDNVVDASATVEYDITQTYHVAAEYGYVNRNSDDPTVEYDSNTVMLRLSASY